MARDVLARLKHGVVFRNGEAEMGTSPREDIRQDLEHFWDTKLQRARERYFKAALELHRRFGPSDRPVRENSYATVGMRREEAEAFADYCRVLATFTELVAIGRMPAPERPNVVEMPRTPQ